MKRLARCTRTSQGTNVQNRQSGRLLYRSGGGEITATGGGVIRTFKIANALIVASLLEALRRKDIYVVLILTVLMTAGAWMFGFFGVRGLEVFIRDVTFSAIGIFSTVLAVMLAARQIPEEVQRRTIYPLLARPISRRNPRILTSCNNRLGTAAQFRNKTRSDLRTVFVGQEHRNSMAVRDDGRVVGLHDRRRQHYDLFHSRIWLSDLHSHHLAHECG